MTNWPPSWTRCPVGRVHLDDPSRLLPALADEGLVRSTRSDDPPGPKKRVDEIIDDGAVIEGYIGALRVAGYAVANWRGRSVSGVSDVTGSGGIVDTTQERGRGCARHELGGGGDRDGRGGARRSVQGCDDAAMAYRGDVEGQLADAVERRRCTHARRR